MQNVQMSQSQVGAPRAASPMTHPSQMGMGNVPAVSIILFHQRIYSLAFCLYTYRHVFFLQMGMSPSRMQQTQGMMGGHANNMVGQTPNQNQFMNQSSFPASATGMNVNVNQAQQSGQAAAQVRGLWLK